MGDSTVYPSFTRRNLRRYRENAHTCLEALARMLVGNSFATDPPLIGLEVELHLVDKNLDPAMVNAAVLQRIDDTAFQTELGQHNIEINVTPRPLSDDEAILLEHDLQAALATAERAARDTAAGTVMIGILPTLRAEHFDVRWMSAKSRYASLNEQILTARSEELVLDIQAAALNGEAPERLTCAADSILPESGCTSVQLHLQVAPADFAPHWNAAQALAGVQVALAANSPFLLGRSLWQETRIPLFEQSTDTRAPELRNQGVRPRAWFGERWITSVLDLFEENVRYFSPLLLDIQEEDQLAALDHGKIPALSELRLHNSTIWRWNRPVYDVANGVPHLRVENRVLPAGPTVIDIVANAAFFFGTIRGLTELDVPICHQMSFRAAERNLYTGARLGMDALLYWPGVGWTTPDKLVLHTLLPLAHSGLRSLGVSDAARERYLRVIEQRCVTRRTGATWQCETVQALGARGVDRPTALVDMLRHYICNMHSNQPVHSWPSF
ncbi:MAG: glutamate-cysteine ligase family protein [Pseudonocardiaceae bacterium]